MIFYLRLFLLSGLLFCFTGCEQSNGSLPPKESIKASLPKELKTSVIKLYSADSDDVLTGLQNIAKIRPEGEYVIPFIIPLLEDRRLATKWANGFGRQVPVAKIAGETLGILGKNGVDGLIYSIKEDRQYNGMADDLKRESVSEGLKSAIEIYGGEVFGHLKKTDAVLVLLNTAEICWNLKPKPGRFDKKDPRRVLKYQDYFFNVAEKEGLKVFIKVMGYTGDERVLPFLRKIISLDFSPYKLLDQFQKASVLAQYNIIHPPLGIIDKSLAEFLMIDFVVSGNCKGAGLLVSQGIDPNIITTFGKPLIDLAWKENKEDIFYLLLDGGADVNIRLSRQNTLLIKEAEAGNLKYVKVLVDNGADVGLKNNQGKTALESALDKLLSFWNGKKIDEKAKPYFQIIDILKKAGSPKVSAKTLKKADKKIIKKFHFDNL